MDLVVCVKRVAEHAEAEFEVDETGKKLKAKGAAYDINEWDDYALEEALRLKEALGGRLTAVTVGDEDSEEVLRKCLAKGADEAIRVDVPTEEMDAYAVAKVLHRVLKKLNFDLVLMGAQASDDGYAQVGPILAFLLGVPHATLVKKVEVLEEWIRVHRELEGGAEEVVELRVPALLTIQTGINEPRYVSIMGLRRASKKPLKVLSPGELELTSEDVGREGSWARLVRYEIPRVERRALIIEGPAEKAASFIFNLLKERGVTA